MVTPRETKAPKTGRAAEWGRATCTPTPGRSGPEGPVARSAGVGGVGELRAAAGLEVPDGHHGFSSRMFGALSMAPAIIGMARTRIVLAYKHTNYILCACRPARSCLTW